MNPEISLIIATYNRCEPLRKLLHRLKDQTLNKEKWEVIIAVDGSSDGTLNLLKDWAMEGLLQLSWFYQENAGQATARHNAILKSRASKIIIIDDDLNPVPTFIESHLYTLNTGDEKTIIIGKVVPTHEWRERPLYEIVREYIMMTMHKGLESGLVRPTCESLVTQNVAFYKSFYLEVGGFDPEMKLGEDTEIGMRFERAGGNFIFCKDAWAIHESNIGSYHTWIKRQYDYGWFSWLAWKKNSENMEFHPLKGFVCGSKLNRLIILLFVRSDSVTNMAVLFFKAFGTVLQKMNLIAPAIATHKAIMSLKQHQGLKNVYGSWSAFRKAEADYLSQLYRPEPPGEYRIRRD